MYFITFYFYIISELQFYIIFNILLDNEVMETSKRRSFLLLIFIINVIFLIKLTIMLLIFSDKFSGKIRLELFKINFDEAKVLTIFVLPIKINFLFY